MNVAYNTIYDINDTVLNIYLQYTIYNVCMFMQ